MSVKMRQRVEHEIVERFIDDAIHAGYRLAVSLERGYDLEEMLIGSRDREKIIEASFSGDDAHVFVQSPKGPTVDNGRVVCDGWVYLVFGNDGWDVISDFTMNIESLLTGAFEISRQYK